MKKTTSGFTIVELLIVIVVIGILAAITVVAYNGIQERAKSTAVNSRGAAYVKGLKLWTSETGSVPQYYSCIAPSSYATCNIGFWNVNLSNDSTFNTTLANYSGVKTPELGPFTVIAGTEPDSPAGLMAYNYNWYGVGNAVLMYTVGPNSDCTVGPLLDSNHTSLAPSGQKYTTRTSTYTRCEVKIN